MSPDDERIPDARRLAAQSGLDVKFEVAEASPDIHPNTAKLELVGPFGATTSVVGSSIGGEVVSSSPRSTISRLTFPVKAMLLSSHTEISLA